MELKEGSASPTVQRCVSLLLKVPGSMFGLDIQVQFENLVPTPLAFGTCSVIIGHSHCLKPLDVLQQ